MLNLKSYLNKKSLIILGTSYLFLFVFVYLSIHLYYFKFLNFIDRPFLIFIANNFRNLNLNELMVDLTSFGSPIVITIITLTSIFFLLIKNQYIWGIYLFTNVVGATIWMKILKSSLVRERPNIIPKLIEISGNSFPSGHALVSTATYLSLAIVSCKFISNKRYKYIIIIFSIIFSMMISFSRLYLGVHYPSDVIGGFLFGLSFVLWNQFIFYNYLNRIENS